jgi:NAD(P)-dependent dehydrogenase (short-subunit alcohol dehydrogenase family)
MLEQGDEGYVVNTASAAGVTTSWALGAYTVSKHAVVALSESLAMQLAASGARIKASVLCPFWVNTRIADAERNRPPELRNAEQERPLRPEEAAMVEIVRQLIQNGMAPSQVGDIVFDAIRQERFYILTDPTIKLGVQVRMEDILQERMPTDIMRMA